jgi:hypothetical protein
MGLIEIEKNYIENIVSFFCKAGVEMYLHQKKDNETGIRLKNFISNQIERRLLSTNLIENFEVKIEFNNNLRNVRDYRISEVLGNYCEYPKSIITVNIRHNMGMQFYQIEYEII